MATYHCMRRVAYLDGPPELRGLWVEFHDGLVYQVPDAGRLHYQALAASISKGRWWWRHVTMDPAVRVIRRQAWPAQARSRITPSPGYCPAPPAEQDPPAPQAPIPEPGFARGQVRFPPRPAEASDQV